MKHRYTLEIFIIIVIITCVTRTKVFGFNFEHREPLVKSAPDGQNGSYFGFSIAQHKTFENAGIDDSWLLVGAPLGQNLQPGSNRSGALFKCPMNANDCVQVETDGKDPEADEDLAELSSPSNDEIKEGQWLGGVVRSQKAGGNVLVCAHRYIMSPNLNKFHYAQGLCYLLESDLKIADRLLMCNGRPMEKLHQQFGLCQLGTSASFVGEDFAAIGAPGSYTWRGTAFGRVIVGDFLTRDKTTYHAPLGDIEAIEKYSYLGMSVGGGKIFDKNEDVYVAGAPRANLTGKVYFFRKIFGEEQFDISMVIQGQQLASSFGYELLIVDINKDGYDDLLVGAPFYYEDGKGGAVYVYSNLRNCKANCKADWVYHGKPQSRFGYSMTSLGDINKDGYTDVAIGAPYEDDHGAVYVYLGSANGLHKTPSQVITVSGLTSFGYSLSGGMDMDNNGYPDLLVGAYESEKVLLFKARPIIDIKISITSDELKNINYTKKGCPADRNSNYTCFSFKACFTIGGQISTKFNVNYHISEETRRVSRIWFQDSKHPNKQSSEYQAVGEVSNTKTQFCESQLVKIKDSVSDILTPIKFKVNCTLENDRYHSPILNKTSVMLFEASFQKECGDDDKCESELVLQAGTDLPYVASEDKYYLEKINEDFTLKTTIINKGEPAYEAKLYVFHPPGLSYVTSTTDNNFKSVIKCSTANETLVVCDIGNPFHGKRAVPVAIRFEVNKDIKENELELDLLVNSTSKELSHLTTQKVVAVLQRIAKFQIRGKASSNLLYGGHVYGEAAIKYFEDIGARVTHKYQIDNNGNWDLSDLTVSILWPLQVHPGTDRADKDGKWLLYLESLPKVSGVTDHHYCSINKTINELNLTHANNIVEEPENLVLPEDFTRSNDSMTYIGRRKRSVDYVVPYDTTEKGGVKRKIVVMDCKKGTAKCVQIHCFIKKLKKGNQAEIDIKSRLWNSTLTEDYSKVDWVSIKSYAEVLLREGSGFEIKDSVTAFSAETVAYPESVLADSTLNWWIIGGAALAGLLLLILLVIILYRCGFFKRKRPGQMSAEIQKKEEADKLLAQNK